jgi:hypothetical protein
MLPRRANTRQLGPSGEPSALRGCAWKSHDRVLRCGAVLLLLAAALVAAWIRARRAMRIDPMVELRYE